MYPDKIISNLKLLGMIGGSYVGYRYGDIAFTKTCEKYPLIFDRFKNIFYFGDNISQSQALKMSGGLVGIGIGYSLWFITIPSSLVTLSNDYPENFKKFKDSFFN